jgi:apolipoprotein N-acyltransferase
VIDPLGRFVARLGLGLEGVLDSGQPAATAPATYARANDIPAVAAVVIALIFRTVAAHGESGFVRKRI